jgi:hypothetical protein
MQQTMNTRHDCGVCHAQELPADAPVVLLLPGLTGALSWMINSVQSSEHYQRRHALFGLRKTGDSCPSVGGSHDVYVQHMVKQARQRGLRAVVFNGRGEGKCS